MFKWNRYASLLVAALGMLCLSPSLFAQTMTVSDETAATGASSVVVDWNYTGGGGVEGYSIDITFDDTLLTPQTTGTDVDGCLSGTDADLESCQQTAANTIRITLTNLGGPELPDQSGTMTFDIAGGAIAGDMSGLALSVASTTPPATPITLNDGSVEIVDVSAILNVQPANINFPATENGTSSAAQAITISNDGTDGIDLEVSNVALATGTHFSASANSCGATPFTLSDGQSCTYDAVFSPTAIGNFNDTVTVTSDAGQVTNDTVALSGEGTAGPAANLAISPTSHDFGDVLTGESSTQAFTVTNNGDSGSEASIDTITPPAGDFSVTGGTCSAGSTTLSDGASCTIVLEFAPAADGAQSGDLVVDGTDTVNTTSQQASAAIQGTGVTQAQFSSDPAPGAVNLGVVPIGGTLNQTVTITNDGNANLDVSCGSLNDPDGVFTLNPDPANFTGIAPDASEQFEVSCTVPDQSTYTASLSCTSNDPDNASFSYDFSCTARPLVIPTMQPWGLVVLTLMMLAIGGFSIRFFRA